MWTGGPRWKGCDGPKTLLHNDVPTSDLPELRCTQSHHVAPASTRQVREPSTSDVAIWLGQKVQASTPSNRLGHRDAVASMASRRRRRASTRRASGARLCAWLGGLERRARRPLISSAQWRRGKFTSASALRDPLRVWRRRATPAAPPRRDEPPRTDAARRRRRGARRFGRKCDGCARQVTAVHDLPQRSRGRDALLRSASLFVQSLS